MKILLTGANGFIGKSLCQRLLDERNNIVAPVRSPNSLVNDDLIQAVHITSLHDDIDWSEMLRGVEVVVHLASRVHVMNDSSKDPLDEYRKINVDATLDLACKAAIAGVKRFIFISSIKVNGESTLLNHPFTEEDIPKPVDPYGISKLEAENGLFQMAKETGMEVVCIRPPLVYGPGVKANFLSMMWWLHKGIPLPFGAIQNKRSLIALDNLVDLILICVDHPAAANQVFLAGDGDDLSTTELLQRVAGVLSKPSWRLLPVPHKFLETGLEMVGKRDLAKRLCGSLQVDISKAKKLLNWVPPVSVNKGVQKTVKYFLNSNAL